MEGLLLTNSSSSIIILHYYYSSDLENFLENVAIYYSRLEVEGSVCNSCMDFDINHRRGRDGGTKFVLRCRVILTVRDIRFKEFINRPRNSRRRHLIENSCAHPAKKSPSATKPVDSSKGFDEA